MSTLVKLSNCWKSHAASHFSFNLLVPYACTGGGGAVTGLTSCMNVPSTISTTYLETLTAGAALLGNIDRTSNMRNDKIWIFDGTADTKVNPGMNRLGRAFRQYVFETYMYDKQRPISLYFKGFYISCPITKTK